MSAPQTPVGGLADRTAIHPASAFAPDGPAIFPAHMRDLPPSIIRDSTFSIAIGGRIEDRRAAHETTVASCEGDRCAIAVNSKVAPNG
jgi:hypothetical protein